jgi:hypothetical protein
MGSVNDFVVALVGVLSSLNDDINVWWLKSDCHSLTFIST